MHVVHLSVVVVVAGIFVYIALPSSSFYDLWCTSSVVHMGRNFKVRHTEHIRYIRNNPQLTYAVHIVNNMHKYGPIQD